MPVQVEEAVSPIEDAIRLNPRHPPPWKSILARAPKSTGRTTEAMEVIDAILRQNSKHCDTLLLHAAILSRGGRMPEATTARRDAYCALKIVESKVRGVLQEVSAAPFGKYRIMLLFRSGIPRQRIAHQQK